MKLSFLLENLFVIIFIFFCGSIFAQQPPCVSAPGLYSANISNVPTTTICNSNPLTLSTSISLVDCPQCTYQWSNGQTGPFAFAYTPGLYQVTITDNSPGGCVGITNSLNITASTLAKPIILGDSFNVCKVGTGTTTTSALLEVSNPCIPCTYQWYNNAGMLVGQTNTTYPATTAGNYYVQVTSPQGCIEYSEYIRVGSRTVSVPPIYVATTSICDTNPTTLSTIDCNDCTYEWYYYDFPPEQRLMITGVFSGDVGGTEPRGIEIYAIGNIPDLSAYEIALLKNSNPGPGTPSGPVCLPTISLAAGSYYYIAHDRAEFINFFNFAPDTTLSIITDLDGDDRVILRYNSTISDAFGNISGSTGWHHGSGWCYRLDNQLPNTGTFDENNWDKEPNVLSGCTTNGACTGGSLLPFPNGRFSFTTPRVGSVQQLIPSIDTSFYSSNITGYYSVAITYPNACKVESKKALIDVSIFNPRIRSEMPDVVGSGSTISSTDTAYLCLGAYVDLYSVPPFIAPPSWSYQWYLNGLPIPGATGYNYRTDTIGLYSVQVINENGCRSTSNVITVLEPTTPNVANPFVTTSSDYFCVGGPNIILTTTPCNDCTYEWLTEDNTGLGNSDTSRYEITEARGYFVKKVDTLSGCAYISPIIEIKDTIYPAPSLSYTGDVICSANPTILNVPACANCEYVWLSEPIKGGAIADTTHTSQNTHQIDTSGKYRIFIEFTNSGCVSNVSNTVLATFQTVNANISTPSLSSVCNGQTLTLKALPDSATSCIGCRYQFLRNGVRMQITQPTYEQEISLVGDYQVIVTNLEGCADTSDIPVTITEVNISTRIRQSAGKICSPTSSVILEIDSCDGCDYQWKVGNTNLIGNQDTFYVATGYAAVETYTVEVSKFGCTTADSVTLDSVKELKVVIEIDSSAFTPASLASPTICGGSSVFLLDTCQTCIDSNAYQYQWYFNGNLITGASFESYQVDTSGTYYVDIIDINNCTATSNSIAVQEFSVLPGFALDFSALGPAVPITYGTFNLDDHLLPTSLHSRGSYSSLTAGGAISGDSIHVGTAGSGFHYITYSYVDSNALGKCVFSTFDTLEVLGAVAMDILNTKQNYLGIPASEACLFDTLVITLTNFTFIPNEVIFVAGGGNTISVPVSPSLSVFAGVYSGSFQVIVPAGARTGKITLSDGTASYKSPNFYVIQNPAVTIDLISTVQPICSNLDTAAFRGLPSGGSLSAHYIGMANNPNLMVDSLLLLDSITDYNNGIQNIVMLYTYRPLYTGTTIACRDSVQDSLSVEIRDVELDSVHYTPISVSQTSEPLSNLTLSTYPLSASSYLSGYSGTYVLGNSLLASTIPSSTTIDSITYHINNGGCLNTSTDPIEIWPAPSLLDSIQPYLCSKDDTVFIQRNSGSLIVNYRGATIYSGSLYTYSSNNGQVIGDPTGLNVNYSDKLNLMEIMTSNGGVDSINFFPPNDTYYIVPANIVGGSTTISIKFSYKRITNFFLGNTFLSTNTTTYTIAEASKTFLVENPSTVSINPVILADTIFCPINANIQLLGFPAGGKYYISGASIGNNLLVNSIFNPTNYASGNAYGLTYVYEGQACVDSAYTGIYLPDPFSIELVPNNGTGIYCKTSPNDSIFFRATPISTLIDTASAQFFIGGVQSGTIFSPTQVGPARDYNVRYIVSDIYGCQQEALDIFTVNPIPNLGISSINPAFCLNDDTTRINLYQIDTAGTVNVLTTWSGSGGIGYVQSDTAELTGNGIINGGISPALTTPYFNPMAAGVGTHDIRYVYTDSNSCMDSLNFSLKVLPLPSVEITTTGAALLDSFYCENDAVPIFGSPVGVSSISGYGSWVLDSFANNTPIPASFDSATTTFSPFVVGDSPGIVREVLFYYYEDNNGCRDTATHLVNIRNFTTDPTIVGLPADICAEDTTISVWADPNGGFDLDSLGWFTCDYTTAFSQLGPTVNTDSILFYPDSSNIIFGDRDVILTFHYTDTSRSCFNSITDTVFIRALPYLRLAEDQGQGQPSSLAAIDLIGSTLSNPVDSLGYYHVCETAPEIPVRAYNVINSYPPATQPVIDHITSDTGTYVLGRGIRSNNDTVLTAYAYFPDSAGYGLDTIRYTYTDAAGCTNTVDHYLFIDSLPKLSFAGLSNYNSTLNRYVYCQAAPDTPSIVPSPVGVNWSMTFNGQSIIVMPFDLMLDTLAVPGVYMNYPLKYYYVRQEYTDGRVCADSLMDTIQVRPSPQLAWVNAPNSYCMTDSFERLSLSATPFGGSFIDETNNGQVIAGIVGDSLFNPGAQAGKRNIYYHYYDSTSGCEDTIRHSIYVYNKPKINFDISGGCSGTQVEFIPTTAPYGLKYDQVAVDSISMVIWNFGDGVIDTFANSPLLDTLVIPRDTHTYSGAGVFYPSLTVFNRGVCDTTFTRRIIISPKITVTDATTYFEPFDVANNGWMQESSDTTSVNGIVQDSLWQWGIAQGTSINTIQQNNTVWGTRLANQPTTYKQGESAWVYSPCFDISTLDRPMIQLSLWRNMQNNVDGAVLQYFDNITNTWEVLGKSGKGINWYQNGYVVSAPGEQINTPIGWTGNTISWENARYRLDNIGNDLRGRTDVRFRIAFASSPSTLLGGNDGIAFDSVKIGNRTRNVLTEHFSGTGYPGIESIENQLYNTIYNNLYGRDVSLIQYHLDNYSADQYHSFNRIDNNQRALFYGISDVDQVRVDGKILTTKTSDLLNYPQLEYLDIEALSDAKFKLEFISSGPSIQYNGTNGDLTTTVRITALEDLPEKEYSLHLVLTEDSLVTTTNHTTMAVMRDMHPNNNGTFYKHAWTAGETYDLNVTMTGVNAGTYPTNTTKLQLVAFVQNMNKDGSKEIYQVETTRDLSVFRGSVDTLDVSVDNIKDHPGYEITTLKLYPNPTKQLFNVEFEKALEADYEWQLVDVVGRIVNEGKVEEGTSLMQIETNALSSGMYIFIVKNKAVYTQRKVIIRQY